jgi:outer membrane murein-binding lipoprotein Lpp
VPRTIRERPRYALLLGLGLACLVALGLLIGLLLAGGDDSTDAGPDAGASVEARELGATRAELEDAQAELDSLQSEFERAGDAAARQRARAQAWRRRALRAERRNRALRRALTQAQQE